MRNDAERLFFSILKIVCMAFFVGGIPASVGFAAPNQTAGTTSQPDAVSVAAFKSMLTVIRHPRCMNCHSKGDFPRQGDDSHQHTMNVRRGPGGQGVTSQKCGTCHQSANSSGLNMPPGAPNWHLPSTAMPMIWQGLTDGQICAQLKDTSKNNHRSVAQIVEHMTQDRLVAWAWNPGEGRNPVPISHDEFSAKVKEWASKGSACPAE
jgi:hypothetical protein